MYCNGFEPSVHVFFVDVCLFSVLTMYLYMFCRGEFFLVCLFFFICFLYFTYTNNLILILKSLSIDISK